MENRKLGVREVPEGGLGAPLIGRARWFLGAIFRPGNSTSSSVARVHFAQAPQLQASVWDLRDSFLLYRELYTEDLLASSIARFMEVFPLVRLVIPSPSPVAWGYLPAVCWLRPYPLKVDRTLPCRQLPIQSRLLSQDGKATLKFPIRGSKSEKYWTINGFCRLYRPFW